MRPLRLWGPTAIAIVLASGVSTSARQPCTASSVPIPVTRANVALTETQEVYLGDAVAEHLERTYNIVRGEANDYLQRLGDRIVAELPPSGLQFRFTLVNMPEANAFATPGGRVYVSRKLVAFTRNEDELAGVVGHEIGHIITRQIAADFTAAFRRRLRVTSFGDREDIFEKYHRLVAATSVAASDRGHVGDDQYEADRVALLAVARAGFSPDAYVELWDRFNETNHNTGNLLSDLLGETRPASKRLREMLHSMNKVAAGCRAVTARSSEAFTSWQKRVIESRGDSEMSATRAVVREQRLEPPLHSDITALKFSPDGRYVLAQDDSSIYVLSRQPLAVLFRIDADDAQPAQFTPDSTKVVFSTSALRVEWWNIASHSHDGTFELVARDGAIESALSPDGRWFAYVNLAPAVGTFRIHLMDVQTGVDVFEKKISSVEGMYMVQYSRSLQDLEVFQLAFSPDGRYFVAGANSHVVAVDLSSKTDVKLADSVRDAFQRRFAFLGTDRLVTVDTKHPEQSAILRFPSGERLKTLTLAGRVTAATHGESLVVRPIQDWPVGLLDLTAGRITMAAKTPALDVYDDARVSELPNGDVGLFRGLTREPEASVTLPVSPLGALRGAGVSADLARVALSGRERGGVWDTVTGRRITHIRGFQGADIENPSTLYADFPARKEIRDGKLTLIDRMIARVDLTTGTSAGVLTIGAAAADLKSHYYVTLTPEQPDDWNRNITLEVRDIATSTVLWTRRFLNQPPWLFYDLASGRLVFEWDISSAEARAQIKADANLRAALDAPEMKVGASLLEVIELQDGKPAGRLLVSTGRTAAEDELGYYIRRIQAVASSGDVVVVLDRNNQAIVYSLSAGKRIGTLFGRFAVVSDAAGLLALQNAAGELQFYDSKTAARKADVHLGSPVRLARFSADGRQLLVVTADQVARLLDIEALSR
jgi:predicted Zn-dependent protease